MSKSRLTGKLVKEVESATKWETSTKAGKHVYNGVLLPHVNPNSETVLEHLQCPHGCWTVSGLHCLVGLMVCTSGTADCSDGEDELSHVGFVSDARNAGLQQFEQSSV